jgi:hypothetical protein
MSEHLQALEFRHCGFSNMCQGCNTMLKFGLMATKLDSAYCSHSYLAISSLCKLVPVLLMDQGPVSSEMCMHWQDFRNVR